MCVKKHSFCLSLSLLPSHHLTPSHSLSLFFPFTISLPRAHFPLRSHLSLPHSPSLLRSHHPLFSNNTWRLSLLYRHNNRQERVGCLRSLSRRYARRGRHDRYAQFCGARLNARSSGILLLSLSCPFSLARALCPFLSFSFSITLCRSLSVCLSHTRTHISSFFLFRSIRFVMSRSADADTGLAPRTLGEVKLHVEGGLLFLGANSERFKPTKKLGNSPRFIVPRSISATNMLRGSKLDFRRAVFAFPVVNVYANQILGSCKIICPAGVRVESKGVGILVRLFFAHHLSASRSLSSSLSPSRSCARSLFSALTISLLFALTRARSKETRSS